jgi:hypothetical protein
VRALAAERGRKSLRTPCSPARRPTRAGTKWRDISLPETERARLGRDAWLLPQKAPSPFHDTLFFSSMRTTPPPRFKSPLTLWGRACKARRRIRSSCCAGCAVVSSSLLSFPRVFSRVRAKCGWGLSPPPQKPKLFLPTETPLRRNALPVVYFTFHFWDGSSSKYMHLFTEKQSRVYVIYGEKNTCDTQNCLCYGKAATV